jgi:ATP synthase protein I
VAVVEDNTKTYKSTAYRILVVEAALTAGIALLLFITVDSVAAYSAAIGGLAYIVPNAYFTKYVFRHSAAESANLVIRWFYVGEAVKVVVTVTIFTAAFLMVKPLNVAALFLTYILMLVLNLRGINLLLNR